MIIVLDGRRSFTMSADINNLRIQNAFVGFRVSISPDTFFVDTVAATCAWIQVRGRRILVEVSTRASYFV